MIEKRFELAINPQGQCDIIDHVESKEKNAICIYNDLGVLPFSSAKALCNLMNELHKKNQQLSKDKQLAETTLMTYKQRVKDELEMRYCLSNHKPVFEFMAKELDITLEGNVE